jgi:hypothetical protein
MDRYMVELINRLNQFPNTQYCIKDHVIHVQRDWTRWQPWHLSSEAMLKYNEYQKDPSKAVAELTGPAPMLRICAEVYLKVAG